MLRGLRYKTAVERDWSKNTAMNKNRLLMETTKIAADRSAAEIVTELVAHGARSISTDYEGGKIVGLRWMMKVSGADVIFDMPARVQQVYKLLQRESPGQ